MLNKILKNNKKYIYTVGLYYYRRAWLTSGFCATWSSLYPSLVSEGFWAAVQVFPNKIQGFGYWLLSPSILGEEQCPETS
jgi:hypothetical protein